MVNIPYRGSDSYHSDSVLYGGIKPKWFGEAAEKRTSLAGPFGSRYRHGLDGVVDFIWQRNGDNHHVVRSERVDSEMEVNGS